MKWGKRMRTQEIWVNKLLEITLIYDRKTYLEIFPLVFEIKKHHTGILLDPRELYKRHLVDNT